MYPCKKFCSISEYGSHLLNDEIAPCLYHSILFMHYCETAIRFDRSAVDFGYIIRTSREDDNAVKTANIGHYTDTMHIAPPSE